MIKLMRIRLSTAFVSLALTSALTATMAPTASAATYADYTTGGGYGSHQVGEFRAELGGFRQKIPNLDFGYVDYIPNTLPASGKAPFVLLIGGINGDARYMRDWGMKLASRGFAVRQAYGGANATFASVEVALQKVASEVRGNSSELVRVADFSNSALVGYSAGAGASFWAGATQGGGIPGYSLRGMVNIGLPFPYQAAQPLVPASTPVLMMFGESDWYGLGSATHATMHGVAEGKNQSILGIRGMGHPGAERSDAIFAASAAWLDGSLNHNAEVREQFARNDKALLPDSEYTLFDQTAAARNWR
jgi:pimeloyl-ACP methyl ester carboxylesterase